MITTYNQRLYPNPFRYGKVNTITNEYEIFEEVQQKLKPFLLSKFSEIEEYFNEVGELKAEIRIIRLIRNNLKNNYDLIIQKIKSNFLTENIGQYIKEFESSNNYQKNLRYLELPLQPLVDKDGFEIQTLSHEIFEDILEEIETGVSFVYDYYSELLPESADLWEEYALLNIKDFPAISHDYILEATYRSFDKVFNKIQKGAITVSNWTISGDINTKILKIVKPKFDVDDLVCLFKTILESVICLAILILIIKYLINKFKPILAVQKGRFIYISPKKIFRKLKTRLKFKHFRVQQKIRQMKLKINTLSFKVNLKYRFLQLLFNKTI